MNVHKNFPNFGFRPKQKGLWPLSKKLGEDFWCLETMAPTFPINHHQAVIHRILGLDDFYFCHNKKKWKLSLLHSLVLPKKLTMYCQFVWALLCWAPTLSKLPAPPSWCANIFFGISSWFFCIPIFVKIISPAQLVQPSKVWDSISFFLNPSCRMMKVKVVFIKGPFD